MYFDLWCNFAAQWSPTCFGHSCGHLQGGKNTNTNIAIICLNKAITYLYIAIMCLNIATMYLSIDMCLNIVIMLYV